MLSHSLFENTKSYWIDRKVYRALSVHFHAGVWSTVGDDRSENKGVFLLRSIWSICMWSKRPIVITDEKDSILLIIRQWTTVHRQSEPDGKEAASEINNDTSPNSNEQSSHRKGDEECSLMLLISFTIFELIWWSRFNWKQINEMVKNMLKISQRIRQMVAHHVQSKMETQID